MATPNAVLMTTRSPILPIRGALCVALTIGAAAARGQALLMAVGTNQAHRDPVGPIVMGGLVLCLVLVIGFYELRIRRIKRGEASKRAELERQARTGKFYRLGRLAQELAHEIKMPLTALSVRAYTLGKILPPGSEALKDVAVIRGEIKRLDGIIKDFLELLRPGEPRTSNVDAKALVQEVEGLMQAQLEQEGIEFKCEAPQGLTFLADPEQIRQVLINLVRNAAESIDNGGTVILRAFGSGNSLRADSSGSVCLEVEDNGPGIPAQLQGRVFDPFFSTKQDGTGLGLAVAAGIVEKHGGRLEFDSEAGKGARFRVILPDSKSSQAHE